MSAKSDRISELSTSYMTHTRDTLLQMDAAKTPPIVPLAEDGSVLRRYERPMEAFADAEVSDAPVIGASEIAAALESSALTPGARSLLVGLMRLGGPALFGGGGAGIEYGSLLKTAARPDILGQHALEVAGHLHEKGVHLLMVPGMSGYPVGAMYAAVAGIPALLLKKQRHSADAVDRRYPAGSFVIPSYTGEGDVVMSADLAALRDIVESVLTPQLLAQSSASEVKLQVRVAGADDIIDKATMSQAVSESALVVVQTELDAWIDQLRTRTGETREIVGDVRVVSWVTPLIKGYNGPHEHLRKWFGITPFAGLNVTSVQVDPPALGIEGLGLVAFSGE